MTSNVFAEPGARPPRDIWRMYALRTLQSLWLPIPTQVLFFRSCGLTLAQIMLLKSALSISVMLLEVPTGYFADRYGRRLSIRFGGLFSLIASACYFLFPVFPGFLAAELLFGVGVSFISGADSAFVYDSLAEAGSTARYPRAESILSSLSGFAEAGGAIIGGLLAARSLLVPYYVQTVIYAVFIALSFRLSEPPRKTGIRSAPRLDALIEAFKISLVRRPHLRWLMLFLSLSSAGTFFTVWFGQSYFELIQLTPATIGLVWAALHITLGASSLLAAKLSRRLPPVKIMFGLAVSLALSFMLLGLFTAPWALVFLGVMYAVRGVRQPLARVWINELVDSAHRATILSINSFLFRIIFSTTAPLFGFIAEITSLSQTLVLIGALWLLCSLAALNAFHRSSDLWADAGAPVQN